MEKALLLKVGMSPYNKRIDLSALGWHGPREARPAPVPSSPSASQAGFRPCSQLIRALYGRSTGRFPQVPCHKRRLPGTAQKDAGLLRGNVCATFQVHRVEVVPRFGSASMVIYEPKRLQKERSAAPASMHGAATIRAQETRPSMGGALKKWKPEAEAPCPGWKKS